jgi:hypothetical protein
VTWDVTSQVNAIYGGGANNGFVLRDRVESSASASEQRFDARSEPAPPELLITFGDE